MRFRVLGSLELVAVDARLQSPRLRRLLAALLVQANTVVSVDRLADVVWGERLPAHPEGAVHTLVSRLRAADGGVELLTRFPGYLLQTERGDVDASCFEDLVTQARAEPPAGRLTVLDEALGLWHGPAYAEFADEWFAKAEATRLEELRLMALEERLDAVVALGRHDEAVGELEALVAEHPLRERPRALLMLALHRAGRSAEALEGYRDHRERLADELGLEPSAALAQLETDILRHDAELRAPRWPSATCPAS